MAKRPRAKRSRSDSSVSYSSLHLTDSQSQSKAPVSDGSTIGAEPDGPQNASESAASSDVQPTSSSPQPSTSGELEVADDAPRMFHDNVVTPAVRHSMQGNKRSNTKPEVLMRQRLREAGYPGYRLQWKKVPGHPDIAYPGRKIAIFVNGCFWHHHEGCKYATTPKSNLDYWNNKFATNQARDKRTREQLEAMGWTVVVVWECELKNDKIDGTVTYVVQQIEAATNC